MGMKMILICAACALTITASALNGDVDYVSLQTKIGLGNIIEKEKQIERE